jgi:serine/threonine protein kinase
MFGRRFYQSPKLKETCVYDLANIIGEGGFATVYSVYNKKIEQQYAMKLFNSEYVSLNDAFEIMILKYLHHPNIVSICDILHQDDCYNDQVAIITPLFVHDCTYFYKHPVKFNPMIFMMQIIDALSYLHKGHVIHCDIKPENIFYTDDEQFVLGDFGIAQIVPYGSSRIGSYNGTLEYAYQKNFINNDYMYNADVDIYALGITLSKLLDTKDDYWGRLIYHMTKDLWSVEKILLYLSYTTLTTPIYVVQIKNTFRIDSLDVLYKFLNHINNGVIVSLSTAFYFFDLWIILQQFNIPHDMILLLANKISLDYTDIEITDSIDTSSIISILKSTPIFRPTLNETTNDLSDFYYFYKEWSHRFEDSVWYENNRLNMTLKYKYTNIHSKPIDVNKYTFNQMISLF